MRMGDVPAHDRPRERLLARGAHALSDRELLAVLLRTGRRGQSALDLADALIAGFGGLGPMAAARPEELARQPGVGPAKATLLAAAFRLGARARDAPLQRELLRRPGDVARIAARELEGSRRERVIVLVCDSANRLLQVVPVGEGAVDRCLFPIREILNAALRHDGRAFAVAHNHPSGETTPSGHDVEATRDLEAAARMVGLRLLGHVVVSADGWRSIRTTPRTNG